MYSVSWTSRDAVSSPNTELFTLALDMINRVRELRAAHADVMVWWPRSQPDADVMVVGALKKIGGVTLTAHSEARARQWLKERTPG